MTTVRFSYRLTGSGWSVGSLTIGKQQVSYECSYLSDALTHYLRAVNALLRGAEQAECTWYSEPGALRWHFAHQGVMVAVATTSFPDEVDMLKGRKGCRCSLGSCPVKELGKAVYDGAKAVLDEWGLQGYRTLWRDYDFPLSEYEVLDKLIHGVPEGESPKSKATKPRRRQSRKRK